MKKKESAGEIESRLFAAEIGDDSMELDLHGMEVHEALQEVESFLQQAFMSGDRAVRIMTGRGTGELRSQVHYLLEDHELVEGFRDSQDPGQMGALTVVAIVNKKL
jgi:DNA mismatch repair protein MutS2